MGIFYTRGDDMSNEDIPLEELIARNERLIEELREEINSFKSLKKEVPDMSNVISLRQEKHRRAMEEAERSTETLRQSYKLEKMDYSSKLDWYMIGALSFTAAVCLMWYLAATTV